MKLIKLAIATSVALALSACSDNENAGTYLIKAKTYLNANQVNEGMIELKNALKLEPKNAEVRFLLGQLYLSQGRGLEAVKELERAKQLKYSLEKVIPLLARAYIITESDGDVIALSAETEKLSADIKSHYLAYKTLAALRSEDVELADETLILINSLASTTVYNDLAQGYVAFSQKDLAQAQSHVDLVLASMPAQLDALMLQGQIQVAAEKYKEASESFEQYLKAQPYSGLVQLLLADALLKAGELEKAEAHADAILAKVNNQPFANYIKASVRFANKDYQQASEFAEKALQANFKQLQLKLIAGSSAFQLKNYEQANYHLSAVEQYLPKDHVARRMLAVSQLQLGLVDDISETLSGFESSTDKDSEFISSLSLKMFELGAVNQARDLVDQASPTDSQDAKQSAREGILKLMMNDPSGMEDLKDAIELDPELIEAELALAFAAVQMGDIEQATIISKKWQENYPKKSGGFNLLAAINIKEKRFEEAKVALKKSLKLESNNFYALTEMVKVEALLDNTDKAKQLSSALIKNYPNSVKVLGQYFQLNPNETGLIPLKSSVEANNAQIRVGILYAEALFSLSRIEESIEVLKSYKTDIKTPKKYWQLLYRVTRELNKPAQLKAVLDDWRKVNPYHIEPVVLLADFYGKKREYSRAISLINSALSQHDNNLLLRIVKLNLLLNSQQTEEAKTLFATFDRKELSESFIAGIEGRLFLLEKNYAEAVPKLAIFYQAKPSHQNVINLAVALQGNNEVPRATTLLEDHIDQFKGNERVRTLLASLYLNGQQQKALTSYQEIIKTQPNNVLVNNNLAWLYMEGGSIDKALLHAETAYNLAPKHANVVDTYSQVLLKSGNKRLSLEKAEQAYELSETKDTDIALNYIEVLIANSRKNEAKKLLLAIDTATDKQTEKKALLMEQL